MKQSAIFFLFLLASQSAFSAESEIHLKDGSVISATILSFDGQTYRVKSSSLGIIDLSNANIKLIRSGQSDNTSPNSPMNIDAGQGNVATIQKQLMSNPDIMRLITSLQSDPQVQALLNDPAIMQSVMGGDVSSLMNNPKFKSLLNNPTIKEILNNTRP